ncbi:hypothetical protein BG011_001713 [Mortierella polycephala]|uniref:RRM domain-containing protein n=1 Tax=Mortierella polycephala TaxID=41804 RepID=A0A9P6U5N6_9FUNG|nr:hypothetical protein BG011_001713 [Mortierella polycephala]
MLDSVSSPTMPTNTLTFTNLENSHFDEAPLLRLRAQAESFGKICFFSPIKTFHRIFVVYHTVFDAQRAKTHFHNTRFDGITLRVYFGQHTELSIDPEKYYLQVKAASEKSSLNSPPGSPPLGHTDDNEMLPIEEFSLEESLAPSTSAVELAVNPVAMDETASAPVAETNTLPQQTHKLRIDTLLIPSTISTKVPRSPISPSSSLYPSTPTLLAFSPAKESMGDQPFITIQDWGVDGAEQEIKPMPMVQQPAMPFFASTASCH